jgi:hypothetical protein
MQSGGSKRLVVSLKGAHAAVEQRAAAVGVGAIRNAAAQRETLASEDIASTAMPEPVDMNR